MPLLFVYGTLKRGKKLENFLSDALFLERGETLKPYPLFIFPGKWYPYLLNCPGKGKRVKGEIYKIDFKTLKRIDRLEEVPWYYYRGKILVKGEKSHRSYRVWTYFHRRKNYKPHWLLEEF
ncbi:MAG: gamma-glutamylcyclotransferase [Epsilonproteobacteria bacterium]|jgi:gamma-glutamylaminecyclotransferase|nr:gamma-glutamylcyclotransferase [Campylobacterota bacterium]NPA89275.1 gamma-glutamylcyclotransferase [Campylobacterota bacterium]